ncbi:MAG: site-2 protease family protein, partial [Sulfuricella sp.]
MELNIVQQVAVYALPVVFAITLHEAAHGYVAKHFGDTTAYMLGRVSLNPLRHIDPIGTVLIPLLTLFLGGILFGWAKPVPVNFNQLRNPRSEEH